MESTVDLVTHVITVLTVVIGTVWHVARLESRIALLEWKVDLLLQRGGLKDGGKRS